MIIKALTVGPMMANCFILGCEQSREAVVIDPGGDTNIILLSLADSKLRVKYIINTHGHPDHVGGNKKMKDATGADILIHARDAPMIEVMGHGASSFGFGMGSSPAADRMIEDGDIISIGNIEIKVIATPGHSPGGISLYTDGVVFVGDTLFAGSIGRTDFPGGDFQTLITSIKQKLFALDDDVRVLTGHGPETTIGRERRFNPFLN